MLEFEVTDFVEARRARFAQYSGIEKTLRLSGKTIAGVVTSVFEDRSEALPKWIVKVLPAPERKIFKQPKKNARGR